MLARSAVTSALGLVPGLEELPRERKLTTNMEKALTSTQPSVALARPCTAHAEDHQGVQAAPPEADASGGLGREAIGRFCVGQRLGRLAVSKGVSPPF